MAENKRRPRSNKESVKRQEKLRRVLYYVALFAVIAIIVIVMDIIFIMSPDKKLSETENRNLQQFPKLNFTTLTNGRFEDKFEDYVADQFPGRDGWVGMKGLISRAAGKTEANGIFLAGDGRLIQNYALPDEERYKEKISEITDFASKHKDLEIAALIAPTALSVYKDLLPANAPAADEDAFMEKVRDDIIAAGVEYVDVKDALKEGAGLHEMYYRTDHHWTTDGAYQAYKVFAGMYGLSGASVNYKELKVSDSFKGTLSASSGFRTDETDEIDIYMPDRETDYSVLYTYSGTKTASFYKTENLALRDQYTVFFDGNHPQIEIETDSDSKKVLLVIKDSYANCFVPFLAPDYRSIIMVDPRYFTDDIESLISVSGVTDVLFLYNIRTLAE